MKQLTHILTVFVALSACTLPGADPAPERVALTADVLVPRTDWYGVYGPQGTKIGYSEWSLAKIGDGETAQFKVEMRMNLKLAAMGRTMVMETSDSRLFEARPPYALVKLTSTLSQDASHKKTIIERSGQKFVAKIHDGANERTMDIATPDHTLADQLGFAVWLRQKQRAAGEKFASTDISTDDFTTVITTSTITARNMSITNGVEMSFYECNVNSTKYGDVGMVRTDDKGGLLSMKIGGFFELRREAEELAKKTEYSSDLFVFGIARIDKPLGEPRKISALTVEVAGPGVERFQNSPEQTIVNGGAPQTRTLKLGARNGVKVKATDAELRECLKETATYPVKDAKIRALATEAVGDAATPREKVTRLVKFVSSYIDDTLSPGQSSALEIVAAKKGDCTEHSLLFATLARAAGVPAREVTGLMYMGDGTQSFGGHAWNEVILDGEWVPVDATWTQTQVDASHIRFGSSEQGMAAAMTLLGQIKLKLVDIEHSEKPER